MDMVGSWNPLDENEALTKIRSYGLQEVIRIVPRATRHGLRSMFWEHDLFVYPSRNEGSPRVLLEALSAGLPAVAAHHPGMDVLDPAEEFIAFTEFDDVGRTVEWVRHFQTAVEDRVLRAKVGRDVILRNHSAASVAGEYLSFYESVAFPQGTQADHELSSRNSVPDYPDPRTS